MHRVTLSVYNDCGAGCTSATQTGSNIALPYANNTLADGTIVATNRPVTLTGKNPHTRYGGRLVISQDRSVVQLTAFDWSPEGSNFDTYAYKREAITVTLKHDGSYSATTFCKAPNTGTAGI